MKQKNVLVLSAVTLGSLLVAALALRQEDGSATPVGERRLMFPDLAQHINDLVEVKVEKGGKTATVRRENGQWKLSDRGGYPAQFEKVKELAVRLSDLEIIEEKTAKKENHKKLALEWPATEPAGSEAGEAGLVTLKDAGGKELASLVVGKSQWEGSKPKVYVRRAGQDQVYLCEPRGQLDVVPDAKSWIEPKFVELENDRVQSVEIDHADGEKIEIARSAANHTQFALQNVPPGKSERFDGVANGVAQALGYGLSLDDVRPVTEVDFAKEPLAKTHFRCVDGLGIDLEMCKLDDKVWMKVSASYTPPPEPPAATDATPKEGEKPADGAPTDKPAGDKPADDKAAADKPAEAEKPKKDVGKEAEELNQKLAPWAFQVPSYKTDVLARRLKDLLAEPKPEGAAEGESGATAPGGADGGLQDAMNQLGAGDETLEPAPVPDDEGKPPATPPKKPE